MQPLPPQVLLVPLASPRPQLVRTLLNILGLQSEGVEHPRVQDTDARLAWKLLSPYQHHSCVLELEEWTLLPGSPTPTPATHSSTRVFSFPHGLKLLNLQQVESSKATSIPLFIRATNPSYYFPTSKVPPFLASRVCTFIFLSSPASLSLEGEPTPNCVCRCTCCSCCPCDENEEPQYID